MDRIRFNSESSVNDRIDLEIALTRSSRPNANGFVSHTHVQTVGVRFGVDGHGPDTEFTASANYADGDFATICD
jgi:hypothetical protein